MASSSMSRKYDVFVSFQGDIRLNFRDHLFGTFQRKGIVAFRDDTMIKKGESLALELIRAIEGSLVYVVVFSKNFASSTWCLRELVMILECVRVTGKHVFPVFYDVDPSEVRGQNVGNYAEAFAKHKERFKQDLDMVQNWRGALTQVANLSGWDMRHKPQHQETEKMVKEIVNVLDPKFANLPKDVVGIHSPIADLENLLRLESVDDVRVVGISGMGGIGKSTLATILYGRISHQFHTCVFIDDVSKTYRHDGPVGAPQQILRQILREEPLGICNPYDTTSLIQRRLCRVRSLIILDNVDQGEQLEKLGVDREWLGAGSRMIITSRNEHILTEYGADVVYKVPLLNDDDSLRLFSRKAFKGDYNYIMSDIMSDYECLANSILDYARGLPLAVKVLGSFLYGRDIYEWRSALARLRECPNNDIMDVLRFSFDGLNEMEKNIFLDIACFFGREQEHYIRHILNCCGFHADIGLGVLKDNSLITIESGVVRMHDMLHELGKQIVRENSNTNPRKWSRLWEPEQQNKVVQENMEKNVEAIVLKHHEHIEVEILIGETLSKMSHLRLLILAKADSLGILDCLSNELRYVEWLAYPFEYLPSNFHPNQLVDLRLPDSRIKQLWKGKKYLPNLRYLDLRYSKNLITMPNFSEFPNIEKLNLRGCEKLVHLGSYIDVATKLVSLNVKNCKNLKNIPREIFGFSSLRDLNISGCSKAVKNPNLFSAFQSLIRLSFNSMCELDVSFCNIREVPDSIGCLRLLRRLNLGGNKFVTLPSLEKLSKLEYLNLEHCKCLKSFTMLPLPTTISVDPYWRDRRISDDPYWRHRGLFIFNCHRLSDRERWSNTTFSWMILIIRANKHFRRIDAIIPGNEIPRWFKSQRLGGSGILIDPPPIMVDNGVIGFAYCVVFLVAPPSNTRGFLNLVLQVFPGAGGCVPIYNPSILTGDLIEVNSTHMWLIYFSLETFLSILSLPSKSSRPSKSCDRVFEGAYLDMTPSVEVLKHGYNWVFEKDLQIC